MSVVRRVCVVERVACCVSLLCFMQYLWDNQQLVSLWKEPASGSVGEKSETHGVLRKFFTQLSGAVYRVNGIEVYVL